MFAKNGLMVWKENSKALKSVVLSFDLRCSSVGFKGSLIIYLEKIVFWYVSITSQSKMRLVVLSYVIPGARLTFDLTVFLSFNLFQDIFLDVWIYHPERYELIPFKSSLRPRYSHKLEFGFQVFSLGMIHNLNGFVFLFTNFVIETPQLHSKLFFSILISFVSFSFEFWRGKYRLATSPMLNFQMK